MPFFSFDQNNSGGSFRHNAASGIGYKVCVEAANAERANAIAETIGVYFDGCRYQLDCDCCGDRWYPAWGDGDEAPGSEEWPFRGGWGIPSYIHYADGRIEEVTAQ